MTLGPFSLSRTTAVTMLVAFMLLGLVAQLGIEAASESATFDEPVYVDAGQQLFHGKLVNLEHPPLAKVAFGAATAIFAPSRPGETGTDRQLWLLGRALTVARWVNIVLAMLIAILVVIWSLETGKEWPVVFTVAHPKARIVGITLGHDGAAHDSEPYQRLLENAAAWAAKK